MSVKDTITDRLQKALDPDFLEVVDESAAHAGHSGAREGGQTHFRVKITSAAFAGKSRIDCHRIIHQLLSEELKGGVHALAIEARAPA